MASLAAAETLDIPLLGLFPARSEGQPVVAVKEPVL
jgi:hypothetical protein